MVADYTVEPNESYRISKFATTSPFRKEFETFVANDDQPQYHYDNQAETLILQEEKDEGHESQSIGLVMAQTKYGS